MRPSIKFPSHVPQKVKLVWERLTCSRLIAFYFAFTVFHCIIQVVFQVMAYSMNSDAGLFLNQLQASAGLSSRNFTLYDSKAGVLKSCWGVDGIEDSSSCRVIWQENPASLIVGGSSDYPDSSSAPVVSNAETSLVATATSGNVAPSGVPRVDESLRDDTQNLDDSDDSDSDSDSDAGSDVDSDSDSDSDGEVEDFDDDDVPTSTLVGAASALPTATPPPAVRRSYRQHVPRSYLMKRGMFITPITGRSDSDPTNTTITGLRVGGLGSPASDSTSYTEHDEEAVNIDLKCVQVLSWPLQRLRNTEREDIVFIVFQIWVFGVSLVALLNESIPHIAAALLTHMLATMWSGFQIAHTAAFRRSFIAMTAKGACDGVNLLPLYWNLRSAAEISVLVLNALALVASAYLSWKLVRLFGWATFRRVGASLEIARLYKIVLSTSILLQLSVFFIVASIALWIDQLYNGSIGIFATHVTAYRVGYTLLLICLPAWLYFGWVGIRKENKWMTIGFTGFSIAIIVQWAAMFASQIWRLTFLNWAFFAIMAIVAAVCTLALIVMVLICWKNYGQGLIHYLSAHEEVQENKFGPPTADIEKSAFDDDSVVGFPAAGAVPTYSAAFGNRTTDLQKSNSSLAVTRPAAAVVLPGTTSGSRSTTKSFLRKAGFSRSKESPSRGSYGEGMGKARRLTKSERTASTFYPGEAARTMSRASVSTTSSFGTDSFESRPRSDHSHQQHWQMVN